MLLTLAFILLLYSSIWEYSVRRYLRGFSDAVIPAATTPEQKVNAILAWMRSGPPRPMAAHPEELSTRDPETTLNYQQLLTICGSATNAFLNLARSSGLNARRLLLLTPEHTTKHVVAEVFLHGDWIIVDPTYRTIMRDVHGKYLTRRDLQNPAVFAQAVNAIPHYPAEYSYESFAHLRIARLPLQGLGLRRILNIALPNWDEVFDWSLLLERESFFALFLSVVATVFFWVLRLFLAWYADRRLRIPRFHLRRNFVRASLAFLTTPELQQPGHAFRPSTGD